MSVNNELEEWLEWFSSNRARVDLTSAAAAGACLCITGLVLLKASMLDRVDPLNFSGISRVVLMTTLPYLVAGLIINRLWITRLRRTIPSWVMIALLGSLLVVVSAGALTFYTKSLASNATTTAFTILADFIRDKVKDGLGVFVALSLFTLPITAAVYYAGRIVGGVRHWYGADPPSILNNHEEHSEERQGSRKDRCNSRNALRNTLNL